MVEFGLDSNNDLVMVNGTFATVKDAEQVVQHIRTRLLTYLGEWFLNVNAGTPWFQEVFVKPVDLNRIETIIKNRINTTFGLAQLTFFEMQLDSQSRKLTISFAADTQFGPVDQQELYVNV